MPFFALRTKFMAKKQKKVYVIDTNVFLSDFNAVYAFQDNDIIVPLKVLEEIDKHKKRQDGVGANARQVIRIFDGLREKGQLDKGVKIGGRKGILTVMDYGQNTLPPEMSMQDPDNQILATVKAVMFAEGDEGRQVYLVSQDINMRVKADALGIQAQDYTTNKIVDMKEEIYTGFTSHLVDDALIDRFYGGERLFLEEKDIKLQPNQYVMLVSNANEKKTALCKFKNYNFALSKVREFKEGVWGVKAKNKEQHFAFDMLMDESIKIVSLVGLAGCGKTLIALAAALEQTLEQEIYKKIIVSRPVQPMGRDIGFLPGTLEEKMAPWVAPIKDNLEYLMDGDKDNLQLLQDKGTIEVEAITFIRGRSIANAFIIIDEAQNLTMHELKTIITRVGEGTKIVLTGDVEQIDSAFLDATNNGLTYAVEKFKPYELTGHITLQKGERSAVASLAATVL
jgi:PhoH-like ATPase